MCIGNTTSPAANSTVNWYPREEERVTTLQEGPRMGDLNRSQAKRSGTKSTAPSSSGAKQSSKY